MCDVVESTAEFTGDEQRIKEGDTENTMTLLTDDEVIFYDLFYEKNGKVYCKHPDTDWHLMEIPKGKALRCPAGTELKIVLPEPLKL